MRASLSSCVRCPPLAHCSDVSPADESPPRSGSRATGLTLSGTPNRLLCNQSGSEAVNIQFNGPLAPMPSLSMPSMTR